MALDDPDAALGTPDPGADIAAGGVERGRKIESRRRDDKPMQGQLCVYDHKQKTIQDTMKKKARSKMKWKNKVEVPHELTILPQITNSLL